MIVDALTDIHKLVAYSMFPSKGPGCKSIAEFSAAGTQLREKNLKENVRISSGQKPGGITLGVAP